MIELKSIFQMSDKNSLILGDELCSGTKHYLLYQLFLRVLIFYLKKNVSFMITSHLHQLTEITIVEIINLDIYHLKIKCERWYISL